MKYLTIIFCLYTSLIQAEWKDEHFGSSKIFVYYPKESNNQHSLMLNLHGCAQKAIELKEYGNWEVAADKFNTIVVIPEVPNGGMFAGCWDFYGLDHSISNRDNKFLIDLVSSYLKNDKLKINKEKVFVSGVSAGGGEALNLLCLAPDIFKGGGLVASPTIGTEVSELLNAPRSIEAHVKSCIGMALKNKVENQFNSQKVSIIYDENDFYLNSKHSIMNLELFKKLYNLDLKIEKKLSEIIQSKNEGDVIYYNDNKTNRISIIMHKSLGHNWPSGKGDKEIKFINKDSISYPNYLLEFLIN